MNYFNNKAFIDYRYIFSYQHEIVLNKMKTSKFFKEWKPEGWELFEEVINYLKIDVDKVESIPIPSPFMYLFLSEKNFKYFSEDTIPFKESNKRWFFKSKTKIKSLLPKTFGLLKSSMEIFENSQTMASNPENARNISLLWVKVKNNIDSIINEIKTVYFVNPEIFLNLKGLEKRFILSSYFDLLRIKNGLELFNIRFSIINNLRRAGGVKTVSEAISYYPSKRRNGQDTFYVPTIVRWKEVNDNVDILNNNYKIWKGVDKFGSITEYIVVDGPEDFSKVKKYLESVAFLDVDIKINSSENILTYYPGRNPHLETDHTKRKKSRWRDDEQNLNDFTWRNATQIIKDLSSDIVPFLSNETRFADVYTFINSCMDSIYSYSTQNSKEDVFLKAWFVIERISSVMKKKVANQSFNEKIKQSISSILNLSNDKINVIVLDEIIIYRNSLIHGGNPVNTRVGAYGAILNIVISYVVQYLMHNIDLLEKLTLNEILETMFYRKNIV